MSRQQTKKLPSTDTIRQELDRYTYRRNFMRTLRNTIFTLVVVAATTILVAVLLMPILRIYGTSMNGTVNNGDLVVSIKRADFKTGDVIAFYYNNNILVKRVIAKSGDWVDIDEEGNVYVNQKLLNEPYLSSKALGETNIELPYQVPEDRIFVMGDNREVSVDSRNTAVGCVTGEQIVGKIIFRVWPFAGFGSVR